MTKEEWDLKQNSLKKEYKYMPTGIPGQVRKMEASEETGADQDGMEEKGEPSMEMVKEEWNKYLTWLGDKKMMGKKELDSGGVGNKLFNQYIKENPGTILSPKVVPLVRRAYQEHRNAAIEEMKAGRGSFLGKTGKDADYTGFMSQVELNEKSKDPNYVGQHLTQMMFPGAKVNTKDPQGNIIKTEITTPANTTVEGNKKLMKPL